MHANNTKLALNMVRLAAAGNMLIHGITRISIGGVSPFDEYLSTFGFPPYTAWFITSFEIVGAIALIAGKWIVPLAISFILELIMGIALVHFPSGWFVVGAGRNGMEYSVLLIVLFTATLIANRGKNNLS